MNDAGQLISFFDSDMVTIDGRSDNSYAMSALTGSYNNSNNSSSHDDAFRLKDPPVQPIVQKVKEDDDGDKNSAAKQAYYLRSRK